MELKEVLLAHDGYNFCGVIKMKLITVLTARSGSRRRPDKCIADVGGKPLIEWIASRLSDLPGKLVIATTKNKEDNRIEKIGNDLNIPVFRGSENDVVKRVNDAVMKYMPNAEFVFRALGDCPFLDTNLIKYAAQLMMTSNSDAFVWHLAPDVFPVYGAREFPLSRHGWNLIVDNAMGDEREHSDLYFHRNRDLYKILYHEPPSQTLFRKYRLEVDWPEDLELIENIAKFVGMEKSLVEIIKFLDNNFKVANLNRQRVEITGPDASYDYTQKRAWMRAMRGVNICSWSGEWIKAPSKKSVPVFCQSGTCFLGYGESGVLYRNKDRIVGRSFISCNCGSGLMWKDPKPRRKCKV